MSERNDAYNKAKELLESLRKDFHVLFSELSEKDKLIETTHNNLLAALEEVKRLKGLEILLANLHKKEVFFRLENNDDGFILSIIDRSIFPRIWADNMKDGVEILAESTDHLINRTAIGDKDWKERYYGDSIEELLKQYTLIKKP